MTGHADRDRGKTGCHFKRNGFFARHENGQGTWPEALHEKGRAVRDRAEIFKLGRIPDMNNQRIVRRAALGSKNGEDGVFVERIGTEPVNGFRGKGDQLTGVQKAGSLPEHLFRSWFHLRLIHGDRSFQMLMFPDNSWSFFACSAICRP